jgi:predicted ATPase
VASRAQVGAGWSCRARPTTTGGTMMHNGRIFTSLARLQQDQGRAAEAPSLLQSVYDRFSEGFETADLKTAKAHLDSMQ